MSNERKKDFLDDDVDAVTKEQIKKMLEEALREKIEESTYIHNSRVVTDTALAKTIQEFLDCFIVLGFDPKGSPIILSYARTVKDANSLDSLLMKFVPRYLSRHGHGIEES
jgi:adenylate kinase family enzyme